MGRPRRTKTKPIDFYVPLDQSMLDYCRTAAERNSISVAAFIRLCIMSVMRHPAKDIDLTEAL